MEKEYIETYSRNPEVVKKMMSKVDRAYDIYTSWGGEKEELEKVLKEVFNSILHANRDILEAAELTVPTTPARYELTSPVIDFSISPINLTDYDRMRYELELQLIMWGRLKGVGGADQHGAEEIIQLPGWYDIWLQAALICEDELTILTGLGY